MQNKPTLIFLAAIFICVGILLTLENMDIVDGISLHWPLFVLIAGSGFIMLFYHRDKDDDFLVWLGTFMVLLGLFFYFLNFTNWNQLSFLWPVFLGIVGFSFLAIGIIKKNRLFGYLGIVFVGMFLIFTLVFTVSKQLWPTSFIVFGLCLLIINYYNKKFQS
jgi:hypothetical protein